MSVALSASRVTHSFGVARALDDVSVNVTAGGAVALVGESGSGKTTLLRCFNRMVEPHKGEILMDGSNVLEQEPSALRRRLGYVQQQGGLLPHWTVSQNVGLVLRAMGRADSRAVDDAIALVGLDPRVHGPRFPRELSGGQRQRVALARALAAGPQAILLDEPFGALDAITRGEVQSAFQRVHRELGLTMLLVTHDLAEAARLATRIVVMRAGRVEQQGSMAELRDSPATDYVRALLASATAQFEALQTA